MRPVALDFETHLIQEGLLAPPVVCGSFYDGAEPADLRLRDEALNRTATLLEQASISCQLRFHKVFLKELIGRLQRGSKKNA